jgi:hypothetical protein
VSAFFNAKNGGHRPPMHLRMTPLFVEMAASAHPRRAPFNALVKLTGRYFVLLII